MRKVTALFVFIIGLAIGCNRIETADTGNVAELWATLAYQGGAMHPPLPKPYLTIDSNGQTSRQDMEGTISSRQVSRLIKDANQLGFFELQSGLLTEDIRKSIVGSGQRLPSATDISTVSVGLWDGAAIHSVEVHAPDAYHAVLPNHDGLNCFLELKRQMEKIALDMEAASP